MGAVLKRLNACSALTRGYWHGYHTATKEASKNITAATCLTMWNDRNVELRRRHQGHGHSITHLAGVLWGVIYKTTCYLCSLTPRHAKVQHSTPQCMIRTENNECLFLVLRWHRLLVLFWSIIISGRNPYFNLVICLLVGSKPAAHICVITSKYLVRQVRARQTNLPIPSLTFSLKTSTKSDGHLRA